MAKRSSVYGLQIVLPILQKVIPILQIVLPILPIVLPIWPIVLPILPIPITYFENSVTFFANSVIFFEICWTYISKFRLESKIDCSIFIPKNRYIVIGTLATNFKML